MATRDGPSIPKKKLNTYGKTSRKRPMQSFLDLHPEPFRDRDISNTTSPKPTVLADAAASFDSPSATAQRQHLKTDHGEGSRHETRAPDQHAVGNEDPLGRLKKRKLPSGLEKKPGALPGDGSAHPIASSQKLVDRASEFPSKSTAPRPVAGSRLDARGTIPEKRKNAKSGSVSETTLSAPTDATGRVKLETTRTGTGHGHQLVVSQNGSRASGASITESSVSSGLQSNPHRQTKRVRLIDQLAAQVQDSSDSDSDQGADRTSVGEATGTFVLSPTPQAASGRTQKPFLRPGPTSRAQNLKFTYGQQRTMRSDIGIAGGIGASSQPGQSSQQTGDLTPPRLASMRSLSFSEDEEDEESTSKPGIRSLHELRQAGANHRFADEMDDLFERIGTPTAEPSRMRRNALLELGSKLQEKSFLRQFCDQGAKSNLFKKIGNEEDVISGFTLISVLLILFSASSAPHLIPQLHTEGVVGLLSKLIVLDEDISVAATQRSSNLSKNGQASIRALKSTLQHLEVWQSTPPRELSPRTLALKFLAISCTNPNSVYCREIVGGVTNSLFEILSVCSEPDEWKEPQGRGVTNGSLALALLEAHSIAAMESDAGPRWTSNYLPIVADILSTVLKVDQSSDFGAMVLKLALNTTNNNPSAATAFSKGELFRDLAVATWGRFDILQQSVSDGAFAEETYGRLILMLGVMINLSEHCPSTRQSVHSWQGPDGSPLDSLIAIYLDNRESTGEADSVEKTQLNVAYGYLAILLGYLCLSPHVRQRLDVKSQGGGMKCLLDSIHEFIALHRRLDTDEHVRSIQALVVDLERNSRLSG